MDDFDDTDGLFLDGDNNNWDANDILLWMMIIMMRFQFQVTFLQKLHFTLVSVLEYPNSVKEGMICNHLTMTIFSKGFYN